MVRMTGLEPARTYVHVDLNHARLPTSPHPLIFNNNYSKSKFIYTKIQLIILNLNPNAGASGGIRTHTQLLAMVPYLKKNAIEKIKNLTSQKKFERIYDSNILLFSLHIFK